MTSLYDYWYIYYSFCKILLTHTELTELTVNKVVKKKANCQHMNNKLE